MTKRRLAAFATITVVGTVVLLVNVLLAADLYAHRRVERSVGVNRQGFRGPVVGRKQPGETRVVMLGGSTVFGDDVECDNTIAAALERWPRMNGRGKAITYTLVLPDGTRRDLLSLFMWEDDWEPSYHLKAPIAAAKGKPPRGCSAFR